jgi:hypothetical protein
MSAAPREPEKYSIDDMMDRLQAGPSENPEDGELVTRADGSQAIRVRKRKRRSNQPHKEQGYRTRRIRIMQVSATLVLVFIAVFAIGGAIIYANSSPFRHSLTRKIEQTSGATVELQQFRMNPKTANATQLSLAWPDGNILKTLSLQNLAAEIFPASFFGKTMTGEEITAGYGLIALQFPKPGHPLRNSRANEGFSAIRFNRYRIPTLDITLGNPSAPVIKLGKTEGSLSPQNVSGRPQLSLYHGDLVIDGWPKLRMDRALVEIRGNEADIIGMRILHDTDDRGALVCSGTVAPYTSGQRSSLAVKLEAFQLSGITGPALGRLFSGRVDSFPAPKSNVLSFLPAENSAAILDIAFRASPTSQIEILGFPFLFALSQTLDEDPWFLNPIFEGDAGGVVHREGGIVSLRNIDLQSKGRLALRGEISMATDQSLTGNLQVGLAEAMIAASQSSRLKSMFGPPKEGFRWITLKIAGSAAAPTDNFKELYSATTVAPRDSSAPAGHQRSTFEELTRPK